MPAEARGNRRSARIWALEERARALSPQTRKQTKNAFPPTISAARRGRKRKSLQDVVVKSIAPLIHEEEKSTKQDDTSIKTDQYPALHCMPKKETLEFVLDTIQRRDTQEIFAQPVDPQEVAGYYSIIKEPMDFGTIRAKLQEGKYTNLEQFEHDVFLISNNAMKFNSSTTVYYKEARAIIELAQRVFYALRTKPENFELEFSQTRRRPERKFQGKAGSSFVKLAKTGVVKEGVSLNGPSIKRTTQTFLASSPSNPHVDRINVKIPSGSRDVRSLNSPETERRMTYMTQTSLITEKKSIVSAVDNAPKLLSPVPNAGTRYMESLRQFVKDLGPTAQMVANMKLGKVPLEAPNFLYPNGTSFGKTTNYPVDATSAQGPGHWNGVINGQMRHGFISNSAGSCKGKSFCPSGETNVHGTSEEETISFRKSLQGKMAHVIDGGSVNRALLGKKALTISERTDACGSSEEQYYNMDLLIATLMQIRAIQNRHNHTPSGAYFPFTGTEGSNTGQPSHLVTESHSWMLNNYSAPMCLPSQTGKNLGTSQPLTSFRGFDSHYTNGEAPRAGTPSRAVVDHEYKEAIQSAEAVQLPPERKLSAAWCPQAIRIRIPPGGDALVVQESQAASAHQMPLFYRMGFPEEPKNPIGQQAAQTSSRVFWDGQRWSVVDNQQPDLALQL